MVEKFIVTTEVLITQYGTEGVFALGLGITILICVYGIARS